MSALGRTYAVRTFGCQMNKHDSERIAGMLEALGLRAAPSADEADVMVFNTCCVRDHAEERLLGQVASLKPLKQRRPHMLLAVGGCMAQRLHERLLDDLPHVDVVFGTHNISDLPRLLEEAATDRSPAVRVLDGCDGCDSFASDLPSVREREWHAWLPITVGCDNRCTYCIVPAVRGPERSRPMEDVVSEARARAEDGVLEITLLGQNVNSYGRDLYGRPRFAEVLTAVAESGVRRIRFTTSHPKDLSKDTIAVMRDVPQVCRALHLPVQSGSSKVLKRMGRRYTKEHYLRLVEDLYAEIPDLALSTDIMVGFPGETEDDFADTLDVVREARFDQAFTFIYSPREGTPASTFTDIVPDDAVQDRFGRLVEAVNASAAEKNRAMIGRVERVLVEGPSKRDPAMILGRSEQNKVVHAPVPDGMRAADMEGTFATVGIEDAHTWFLSGTLREWPH